MTASPKLVRGLGTWDVSLITFSTIVGSAIFIAASIVPRAAPHPTLILLLWTVGGLITLAFVFTTLWERPLESLWGLGVVVLGVPAYAWWRRTGRKQSYAR